MVSASIAVVVALVFAFQRGCSGVSSTFKFGRAVGAIDAVCEAFRSPVHYVTPQKWKKLLGLDSDKHKSLELARSLWPNAPLSRKRDNNRAEALLLAEYLRREQL